ncbi:putative enoyl-CoA hydratase echA8 [Pseudovibrio axinellae]|uniref:Enoyl-CoA hydratase domain-containing protein 3, mitochondrial n=1 Tax=Pseudovibrio axinellae TaxID=989403 RepID=A0A165WMT3_9HYPH|nr:enoyl-CoA hydratase [Pseudovibrio axinellae]KZL16711.1 putative enoyl-CoA hydratase echA8 [Pseudovibrio axinellae]SEQ77823.1 Enoyl-CoA hydratase/carnithine racemase [Pseudovibrio axinellae]
MSDAGTANDQSEAERPMLGSLLHNGVQRIVMQRPERMNALSLSMMKELCAALDEAAANPEVRVVLLGAEGKVFCAGHDLKELTAARAQEDGGKAFYQQTFNQCAELMQKIVNLPKPVIAVVTGVATAAGCQLVASCDLAIALDTATFCTPGVNIGLFCSTPMVALTRNIGRKQAMEMLLTGESIDASTAKEYGLINRVVQADYLEVVVQKYGEAIASKSALTVKTGKEAFYKQAEMPLADAYAYTSKVMTENMLAHDAEEGINAFLQKRKPDWTDT